MVPRGPGVVERTVHGSRLSRRAHVYSIAATRVSRSARPLRIPGQGVIMRLRSVLAIALVAGAPALARAQAFTIQAAAGPTLVDRGYSVAGGAGWAPWSRVTLTLDVERTVLSTRVTSDGRGGGSVFRGGAITLGAAGVRVALFPPHRLTPYVESGFAAGRSTPTVNDRFPDGVTNPVRAFYAGAGVQAPLGPRLAIFADARMQVGADGGETLAVAPLRAGLRWRF
jgi:hypothetical protein